MAVSLFWPAFSGQAAGESQEVLPEVLAGRLLDRMTPEERVGQLFLVTFSGTEVDEDSPIFNLITNKRVGGVVLQASNDNFVDAPDTIAQAYQLISDLQDVEWQSSQTQPANSTSVEQVVNNYIPLFIGIPQAGDGSPNDQILSGLTSLPDLMSIGATWQSDFAEQVGAVMGEELSALGFNLFLGPSLDVLEMSGSTSGSGLGADVFGGDPYWVGKLGQAYVSGLHNGSNGRMVVIAKHFPGRGSADRPAGEEAATVRKSLEELKQIELAPFFAVTGNAIEPADMVDGLLVSHIRYQGFQGNIRATTRPVSFDPQALSQILSLPEFAAWRVNGGLVVSDDLGSTTVRNFYDPGGQSFTARLVVLDAFLAGNDLLYLGNIVSSDAPDTYTTIIQTMEFFAQKYREDPVFTQRVDDSVMRILTLKYRLYDEFTPDLITPSANGLNNIGQSPAVAFEVARQSATLISPAFADLGTILPDPPDIREHILILTDTRSQKQCSKCAEQKMIPVDALQSAVLRLYGPQGGGQVVPSRLVSYSFNDLPNILQGGEGNRDLEYDLSVADWVIICMLDTDPSQPETILRRFLSERQDLLRSKRLLVFAFNAPYYLDATDISKLTAYYGLYSKSAPFVDVAARLLFQEISPSGALPVSVPGIGYDLLSVTAPDPDQVIDLSLDVPPIPTPAGPIGPEPNPTPSFRVGDTITVRTDTIIDHNRHPVPDGTVVQFVLTLGGSSEIIQQVESPTSEGVARASFNIDRSGLLEIRATSDPATISVVLQLDVTSEGVSVTALAPTPVVIMVTSTPGELATQTPPPLPLETDHTGIEGWFLMLIMVAGIGSLVYWLGRRFISLQWGFRWALCTALGGLMAYTYLALGLPGGAALLTDYGFLGVGGLVLLGTLVGWGSGWLWSRRISETRKRAG